MITTLIDVYRLFLSERKNEFYLKGSYLEVFFTH